MTVILLLKTIDGDDNYDDNRRVSSAVPDVSMSTRSGAPHVAMEEMACR